MIVSCANEISPGSLKAGSRPRTPDRLSSVGKAPPPQADHFASVMFGAGRPMSRATVALGERRCAIREDEGHPIRERLRNEHFRAYRLRTDIGRYRDGPDTGNQVALQAARQAARIAAGSRWFAWVAAAARLNATSREPRKALPAAVMVGDGHQNGVRHKA